MLPHAGVIEKMRMAASTNNGSGAFIGLPLGVAAHRPNLSSKPAEDAELVRAAQQGDHIAFEQLVRRYDRAVLGLALQITRSLPDAQDIYQEAFLRAYRYIARFNFQCSFYTWMYRIVSNLCFDYLRKVRVRKESASVVLTIEDEELDLSESICDERPGSNPEHSLFQLELGIQILHALEKLTPRERMVFHLRHYEGLKLRTVAVLLDTTEGTAKNTLFRATHKLRRMLAPAIGAQRRRLQSS